VIVNIHKTRKRYATILADPPWKYAVLLPPIKPKHGGRVSRDLPYDTMTFEEIAAVPVGRIAATDSQLWLWTTNSHLHEALHVIEAWGFTYKGVRTWFKGTLGLGTWLRGATEQLLFAVQGNPRYGFGKKYTKGNPAISTAIADSVKLAHSRKPVQSYRDIERVCGDPKIELFARRARPGWDSWGDEAKDIDRELERDMRRHL
jgi:N6-adenosine-specific RNA methylase IME4